ncbi:MAG: M48 family metallopeptidase [Patescibacteria group bacterium]
MWIIKKFYTIRLRPKRKSWAELGTTKAEAMVRARVLVKAKLEYWNQFYNFSYNHVASKAHKSRWGSCSRLKNLNFNCKIIFLPEALVDYIVVHELCHLQELNHGKNFWHLVGQAMPDWKIRRQALRKIHI